MAKAIATCTCKTCGCTFAHEVYGRNRNEADYKAEWAEGHFDECDDCYKARIQREREEANAAAAKEAADAGLPELTGSEKQVAWAMTIRATCYRKVADAVEKAEADLEKRKAEGKNPTRTEKRVELYRSFERYILSHTAAHWWIDNRSKAEAYSFADIRECFEWEYSQWAAEHDGDVTSTPESAPEDVREAAMEEMIAAPEDQTHAGAVDITVTETEVSARYDKDDDFRAVVKRLGYRWDADRRVWCKAISVITGTAQERAAELGSNLLNAGFAVQIADPETRAAAVDARYEPEHRRWITVYTSGDHKGWLCVRLPERGDGVYEKARAIKGSRYCRPNVAVPPTRWQEVLDFADLYDYRISPYAQEVIDAQKAAIVVVAPAPAKTAVYEEHDPADVLTGPGADLSDLMEDD